MDNTYKPDEIVFTGLGMITSFGCGFEPNLSALEQGPTRTRLADYRVTGFNPLPHLTDKKVVKVVSARDVLGLVAFENCQKAAEIRPGTFNPERTGLYVGAPPSACADSENYCEAIKSATNAYGDIDEAAFGETFRSASPTTLLVGLPNNVLCYGSKTSDARGPNSNYTALEMSGHMAVMGGARAMRLGRIDCAIVGGYSGHSDRVFANGLLRHGMTKPEPYDHHKTDGTVIAEGAVFMAMEKRSDAQSRGIGILASYVGGALASDGLGPYQMSTDDCGLRYALERAITKAHVHKDEIGIVMMTAAGVVDVDALETSVLQSFFADVPSKPVLASTTAIWGNLMEAGGLAEIGVVAAAYRAGEWPSGMMIRSIDANQKPMKSIDAKRPIAAILRSSPWGEYSVLLVRCEPADAHAIKG